MMNYNLPYSACGMTTSRSKEREGMAFVAFVLEVFSRMIVQRNLIQHSDRGREGLAVGAVFSNEGSGKPGTV